MTADAAPLPRILSFLPSDPGAIAVAGEGVPFLTSAIQRMTGLSLMADGDRFAVLASGGSIEVDGLRNVSAGSLDVVILRRAWSGRRDVATALGAARSALRSGGIVLAAELDARALLDGPDARYPTRALYRALPGALGGLRTETVPPSALSIDAVREGFRDVTITYLDEVRGVYRSAAGFWDAMHAAGWRGDRWLGAGDRDRFFENAASVIATTSPLGEVTDREPWFVVTGIRP